MTFESIGPVRGLSDDERAIANGLLEQLDQRKHRNLMRSSIYDGKRAIRQVGTIIPPQYYRLGLVLGWCAKGVDSLVRRTTLERFTWADGDLDSLGARDLWDANYLRSEVNAALVSSVLHGVSFLVAVKGEDDEPDALILSRDALSATGTWNPRTRSLTDFISVTERAEDRPTAFTLYLDGITISAEKGDAGWEVTDRSEHGWGVPAQPLTYRPRIGRPFGSSRITPAAIAAQDAGTRDLIRLEGHMDIYSYPELILLGADGSVFKDDQGNTLPAWQTMLGRVKGIPDDEEATTPRASVQSISAASPEPQLSSLSVHAKVCARELSLPDSALALTDVSNPTSAESYDASQYELIADARGAIDDWSTPIRKIHATALAIQNGLTSVPDEWAGIDSKWRNPQFLTQAAEADSGAKRLGAVPWLAETEVGLELMGLSDDQIRRAQAERRLAQGGRLLDRVLAAGNQATPDADAI
ncbi:phage portal protein [Aeromicrobium sp. Leaf291]|uniref:phage portal protein n=1 Tax=Aeromicrobium sp. Leaf291 TaxID=1736325 RepID=UPI0006FC46E6|nr:phage portal protein [Aeromicrobium sp. Leaf291]KQP83751.1 portal protein [Aeromicrobium sp. Leaf291]